MDARIGIVLAVAAAGVGFVAGRIFPANEPTRREADEARVTTAKADADRLRAGDDPWSERDGRGADAGARGDDRTRKPDAPRATVDPAAAEPHDGPHDGSEGEPTDEQAAAKRARKQRELVSAGENCLELLGQPIEEPKAVDDRFSGPTVSRAVRDAIDQTGVTGDVEGVDCSEFPCIVFARLAGDEEDIEEIERSAALDPYEGDVLTLLLWATTVEEEARTQPTAKETGLFAISYYDFDYRAELGADLDRRIRARVLEVWNEERPGPPGSAPAGGEP